MILVKAFSLASLVFISTVTAQSANPGLGVNSKAQGATQDVTPGAGPNG